MGRPPPHVPCAHEHPAPPRSIKQFNSTLMISVATPKTALCDHNAGLTASPRRRSRSKPASPSQNRGVRDYHSSPPTIHLSIHKKTPKREEKKIKTFEVADVKLMQALGYDWDRDGHLTTRCWLERFRPCPNSSSASVSPQNCLLFEAEIIKVSPFNE